MGLFNLVKKLICEDHPLLRGIIVTIVNEILWKLFKLLIQICIYPIVFLLFLVYLGGIWTAVIAGLLGVLYLYLYRRMVNGEHVTKTMTKRSNNAFPEEKFLFRPDGGQGHLVPDPAEVHPCSHREDPKPYEDFQGCLQFRS